MSLTPRRRLRQLTRHAIGNGKGSRHLKRSTPDRLGGLHPQPQLGAFVLFAQRIAGGGAGEAALRRDSQPVEIDVTRRLVGAPLEVVHPLQGRRLAADEAEYHALVLRQEAQRLEIAGAWRVIFE